MSTATVTQPKTRRVTRRTAPVAIKDLAPFTNATGSFTGSPGGLRSGTGHMAPAYAEDLRAANAAGLVEYIVYSYATPIAWLHAKEGWIVPAEHYSVTTSQHQGLARYGASLHSGSYRGR